MKFSKVLLAAACGIFALSAGAYEYTFSGDKNVMDSFRFGKWMPKAKMAQETSFQNADGRVMLAVGKENPAWYPNENETFRDGIATFKFQMINNSNVILRVRDNYNSGNDYYAFQFQPSQKRVNFLKRYRNKTYDIGKAAFTPSADKKYELQAICKGNTFSLKVNGKVIGTWTDENSPLLAGLCSFGTNWGTKVFLDSFSYKNCDVTITAPAAEKPAPAPVVKLEKKK
jgi:hypothetical protein